MMLDIVCCSDYTFLMVEVLALFFPQIKTELREWFAEFAIYKRLHPPVPPQGERTTLRRLPT